MQRVFLLVSRSISAYFSSISDILRWVTRLTSVDFSSISAIFSNHIFRGESPYLSHLLFLLSKCLCCLSVASMHRLFCLLSLCIHLIFHLRYLTAGITPPLCQCTIWFLNCLSEILIQIIYLLPPILTFSLHNLFKYVNLFLAGVYGKLVIWCLIVCLGFEFLDLVLQICHFSIIYLLRNYHVPFVLVIFVVCNVCILTLNRCNLSRRFLCLTHFCSNSIFWQASAEV